MKKIVFTLLILSFGLVYGYSQDVITLVSGTEVQGKVTVVGVNEIRYKRADNLSGPDYILPKAEVASVRYENGSVDVFGEAVPLPADSVTFSDKSAFIRGQNDAMIYYHGYLPASTGTCVASLLSPLVGLIPAIACSSSPPQEKNLNYSESWLRQPPEYRDGYRYKARKIKNGKIWKKKNWTIGLGVNVIIYLVIMSNS